MFHSREFDSARLAPVFLTRAKIMLHGLVLAAGFLSPAWNGEARVSVCAPTSEFSVPEGAYPVVAVGIGDVQYFQVRHGQRTFPIRDRTYHASALARGSAHTPVGLAITHGFPGNGCRDQANHSDSGIHDRIRVFPAAASKPVGNFPAQTCSSLCIHPQSGDVLGQAGVLLPDSKRP